MLMVCLQKNSRICSLEYGVFNSRPPKPRCVCIECQKVLAFLKEKFGGTDQFSNKELKIKVTILLVSTTPSRISALHILDLNMET